MKRALFLLVFLTSGFLLPVAVSAAQGDITLFEVFSNPAGSDTGLEFVTIKNNGSESVSLAGWTLYPDGVGYYTFPDVVIGAEDTLSVRLRASGTDSKNILYHAGASSNMGNSYGSVALFSSATRNETTLVDFVQYGKSGETWESSAEKAGLWQKGSYAPVDSTQEDYVLRRKALDHSSSAWEFVPYYSAPVVASESLAGEDDGVENDTAEAGSSTYSGPTFQEHIRAYAGEDRMGLAGGKIEFTGRALGFEDDVIESDLVRYLWNFGDGTVEEGRKIIHTYRYPGTYIASLMVVQGEESYRDYIKVTVRENPVVVSAFSVPEGWIQLSNASASEADISGWSVAANDAILFHFPDGTFIAPRAKATFSLLTFKVAFPQAGTVTVSLRYPNGELARTFTEESKIGTAKPALSRQSAAPLAVAPSAPAQDAVGANNSLADTPEERGQNDDVVAAPEPPSRPELAASAVNAGFSDLALLVISIAAGGVLGLGVFMLRARFRRQES